MRSLSLEKKRLIQKDFLCLPVSHSMRCPVLLDIPLVPIEALARGQPISIAHLSEYGFTIYTSQVRPEESHLEYRSRSGS